MLQTHPADRSVMKFPIWIVFAALAACSTAPERQTVQIVRERPCIQTPLPSPTRDIGSLMTYYDHLGTLSGDALAREKEKASMEYSRSGGDLDRMKLAMILSLPDTAFRDRQASLDLLAKGAKDGEMNSLARLLKSMILESQNSDDARRALEQTLEKERKHADTLQNKIDAIKQMEKNLLIHNKGNP